MCTNHVPLLLVHECQCTTYTNAIHKHQENTEEKNSSPIIPSPGNTEQRHTAHQYKKRRILALLITSSGFKISKGKICQS